MKKWPLGGYESSRFTIPDVFSKWISRYDMSSEELQNLEQQGVDAIYSEVVDLSTAMLPTNPYILGSGGVGTTQNSKGVAGRALRVRGVTTATVYKPSTNLGVETVAPGAIIGMWVNKKGSDSTMHLVKHGDGYRGDFQNVFLFWPAQANTSMRITVYKFNDTPWMPGDAAT